MSKAMHTIITHAYDKSLQLPIILQRAHSLVNKQRDLYREKAY